ncbi:hypothetical protein [Vibrio sp. CyArs1]|uniref:hypothetical protein n=1 Tax=Vibrio sp. CyArs1 TaxID=2682577 RepID=UPI001F06EA79|nr:hypothetical protein [Vibrio sp. CyArs1]
MNTYVVLEKSGIRVAVNIVSDDAGDEIRALENEGFVIVNNAIQANSKEAAIAALTRKKTVNNPDSNYSTAKLISSLISVIGWTVFAVGIIVLLLSLGMLGGRYGVNFWLFLSAIAPGAGTMVSGLFLVATAQVVRATVDNADNSRQILEHLQRQ